MCRFLKYINRIGTRNFQFETSIIGIHDRKVDSEAKLFEYAAKVAKDGKQHVLNLLSERCMCESCCEVMRQFMKAYPNVTINVVSNSKEKSLKNKNRPWAGRTR